MRLKNVLSAFRLALKKQPTQVTPALKYHFCGSMDELLERLRQEAAQASADKIVVVSGLEKIALLTSAHFPKHEFLANSTHTFGWLLKICEYSRQSSQPQVIISRFPRDWNPPRIKVVQASFDPNIFAVANGSVGGRVFVVEASDGARFMADPENITLNVIDKNDQQSTLAVFFVGLYASSYYQEVLAGQGCPPRIPVSCKVLTFPGDPSLETAELKQLKAGQGVDYQASILAAACADIEARCVSSERGRENTEYNGGVLLPKFPQNEQLPPGARSARTAR